MKLRVEFEVAEIAPNQWLVLDYPRYALLTALGAPTSQTLDARVFCNMLHGVAHEVECRMVEQKNADAAKRPQVAFPKGH